MADRSPISQLTNHLSLLNKGGHILYMFNEMDKYIENAVSFIEEGIEEGSIVFIKESDEVMDLIKAQLAAKEFTEKECNLIIYLNNREFYLDGKWFNYTRAGQSLISLVQPYLDQGYYIRTWGHIPFPDKDFVETLINYECNCDEFISEQKIISVCLFNGLFTPAYVQNELLKTHTHLLLDNDYNLSPFYNKKHHASISIEEIERIQRIEVRNQELQKKNKDLVFENQLIKSTNEVIKGSELKLRTLIKELPIPIIIRNENHILFVNEIVEEALHIHENQTVKEIKTTLKPFFEQFDFNLIDSTTREIQEQQFIHMNGERKYYLVKSIDILFEKKPAILHAFVDMTQEKENENMLIRSEKLQIAGELAASIAHELRNPLTSIKGFFHMLKNAGVEKEMYYTIIEDELSRIEQISAELLTLAKPHSENRKNHNLVQIIEEIKVLLTSEANMKSIELVFESHDKQLSIYCEETKIKQVFINLIKNAIEAMDSPGKIVIKAAQIKETIQVQVIDQGCGISEELINKIGEPFYTTKEQGTGIGLMVCYQIIGNHGGTIDIESSIENGTIFTVTLPVTIKV
ncbi:ATP-binding protein [Alkalihalobacillus sp. 1P02AB]|uniref:ATP-binding protein n=1 Tax=Alkalihalobacillus sp. 1P02AB TaxID=3132260 RepID=UPI0039A4B4CC